MENKICVYVFIALLCFITSVFLANDCYENAKTSQAIQLCKDSLK